MGEYSNQEYVRLDRAGKTVEKEQAFSRNPVKRINAALAAGHMPLSVEWNDKAELVVTRQGCKEGYGIDHMSDGERAALILTICVILAKEGALILIDEPERHLHRSITTPLLDYLKRDRQDLIWVVATHDLGLAKHDPSASALILYEYVASYNATIASGKWNAELAPEPAALKPEIQDAIYGAREQVLFVEDNETSLDKKLYELFFPKTTIITSGSCRNVEASVRGLRSSTGIHHMKPAGLVDADNRADLDRLRQNDIHALRLYAIESIYFHSEVIKAVLEIAGTDMTLQDITSAACKAITDERLERFARDASYKGFHDAFIRKIPAVSDFEQFDGSITVSANQDFEASTTILERLRTARDSGNWDAMIAEVKIKSTSACGKIAELLGYKDGRAYETVARRCLMQSLELIASLRQYIPDPFANEPVAACAQ